MNGGGVLIAIRKHYNFTVIPPFDNSFESIFIKINLNNTEILLNAIYIPPQSMAESYIRYIENIQNTLSNYLNLAGTSKILLIGDYNLPGYEWITINGKSKAIGFHRDANVRTATDALSQFCDIYNLMQLINSSNIKGNLLDLAFSNINNVITQLSDYSIFDCDNFHSAFELTLPIQSVNALQTEEWYFDFKRANYNDIIQALSIADWPDCSLPDSNINVITESVNHIISNIINDHVPKITIRESNFPAWFSNELIQTIKEKKRIHALFKEYNSNYYKKLFKFLRSKCKTLSDRDVQSHASNAENMVIKDSKKFFLYVNSVDNSRSLPNTVFYNGETADTSLNIANLFAKKFGSVYKNNDLSSTIIPFDYNDCFNNLILTEEDVKRAIDKLSPNSSPGPDGIHPLFVKKHCASNHMYFARYFLSISTKWYISGPMET